MTSSKKPTTEPNAAFIAFVEGRYSDAVNGFTEALKEENQKDQILVNRAACYYALELYRKSLQDCDAALDLNQNLERAYLIKGRCLSKMGKLKIARKAWRQGARINKDVVLFKELLNCLGGNVEEEDLPAATSEQLNPQEQKIVSSPRSTEKKEERQPGLVIKPKSNFDEITKNIPPNLDIQSWQALTAAAGQIQHGVGDIQLDKIIALGYFHVNSGHLAQGIQIFDTLLSEHPNIIAAFLGRGTAYALGNQLKQATDDFSSAIRLDSECVDAYKRRGQTLAARGLENESLEDFTKAIQLHPDHEAYHQRGLVYYRKKNFKRAVSDFEAASRIDHSDPHTWNHMGLCYDSLGLCAQSVEAHMKAISLKPDFKEAYANLGQAYKDWAKFSNALENFNKALQFDSSYSHGYHLRGLAYFGVGDHPNALDDLQKAVKLNSTHVDTIIMLAVVKHGLGLLKEAVVDYQIALNLEPQNPCWYQKEIALWWHHRLDAPNKSHNMDLDLDPQFKEFWCKRQAPSLLKSYTPQPPIDTSIKDVEFSPKPKTEDSSKILKFCEPYGRLLHLDAPGYLSNKRQQQMAGIATLHVAQVLRDFWYKGVDTIEGKLGTQNKGNEKKFNWRYVYDIVIRWRQFSEPNDPVWWVDLLTPEQFAEGFGSHTPMITGQCHVVRYSPMIELSFPIMKEEMLKHLIFSENKKQQVREAKTCDDLYNIMRRDFWIVTPCLSNRTGKILEGTRITLQKTEPEGFEFSIRTPGTPPRWIDYDLELQHAFDILTEYIKNGETNWDILCDQILTITFYWYNFMPLSRGTAACGYIMLVAMFLAIGIKLNTMVPHKFLVDWQGILRPTPGEFIAQLKPWMYPNRIAADMEEFERVPSVGETYPTVRSIIEALNCVEF